MNFNLSKTNFKKKSLCTFAANLAYMVMAIDIGNTRIKAAVFEQNELLARESFAADDAPEFFSRLVDRFTLNEAVTASSGHEIDVLKSLGITLKTVGRDWRFPFVNDYRTPETLGIDRMVLAAGAVLAFPDTARLVVDAGTCVTYDFIDGRDHYLGGGISPGLALRYRAMHQFTARLPQLDPEWPPHFIGTTTAESMHSGAAVGLALEIDGFIDQYREAHPNFIIILTGGDSEFLAGRLKNRIFASPNFLLESLNKLHQYQNPA